jgi:hypothetical protein
MKPELLIRPFGSTWVGLCKGCGGNLTECAVFPSIGGKEAYRIATLGMFAKPTEISFYQDYRKANPI